MTVTPLRTRAANTDIAPLPDHLSARRLLGTGQSVGLALALLAAVGLVLCRVLTGFGPSLVWCGQFGVAAMTAVYVAVIGFKLALVFGAGGAPVLRFETEDLAALPDDALPDYTVLVPLHREGAVLPHLLERLADLDYPA